MKEKIKKVLIDLEKEKGIKILFAVESGSRAWGMESENSDYDVRFVYIRKKEDYLTLDNKEEVITANFDNNLNKCSPEGCYIDIIGFDIYKFLKMLIKSNPTCIEWINSDIVYVGEVNEKFKDWILKNYNPISLYYHYRSMCEQNYKKYIDSGNKATYKKYLYSMRGLVYAKFIWEYNLLPSIKFPELLKAIKGNGLISNEIINELLNIINLKKKGKEKDIVKNYSHIDSYIENFLKEEIKNDLKIIKSTDIKELNKEILKLLK